MRHFPIFLDLTGRKVIVSGAGECAVAKLRLLLKTEANITVFGTEPAPQTLNWARDGSITLHSRHVQVDDITGATLIYAANEDVNLDAQVAKFGAEAGILVNIVDNLEDSAFITPAIVDRSPVTVAIGTEGAAPVLARKIKQQMEELLPKNLGQLAAIGRDFRKTAAILPMGRKRRDFWSNFYFKRGPIALAQGGIAAVQDSLQNLLTETLDAAPLEKRVFVLNANNGDPDLLTIKARNILHEADIVIHDIGVSTAFLELARREALIVTLDTQHGGGRTNPIDVAIDAPKDAQIIRIIAGEPAPHARAQMELMALGRANIPSEILQTVSNVSPMALQTIGNVSSKHKSANQVSQTTEMAGT
jgi:uroporphyrin-III C-methyltransferase/precorrin-2 dehydrogenase/sirohydrochlorin ferrochelatase